MFNEIILLTITVFLFNIMHTYKQNVALITNETEKLMTISRTHNPVQKEKNRYDYKVA